MEEKLQYGCFKRQTGKILLTWTWLQKGNLKRDIESLQIAAKNNAVKTNYIKAKMDNTQQKQV